MTPVKNGPCGRPYKIPYLKPLPRNEMHLSPTSDTRRYTVTITSDENHKGRPESGYLFRWAFVNFAISSD